MKTLLFALSFALTAAAQLTPVPGWHTTGMNGRDYSIAVDRQVFHSGAASGSIWCPHKCGTFGSLAQTIRADQYRGERIRLSAWVKAENAKKPRLWMRIDGPGGETLAFDNMDGRAKSGTFEWRRQEIVLNVGRDAAIILFGLILEEKGRAWIDDVQIEVVGKSVKSTNTMSGPSQPRGNQNAVLRTYLRLPLQGANLNFEDDGPKLPRPQPPEPETGIAPLQVVPPK